MKIYSSDICGDCRNFKALMAERGIQAQIIDITESVPNLREFLKLRDAEPLFDEVRERGGIGIPLFVNDDGQLTLDPNEALAWIGEAPVEDSGCEGCK